MQSTTDAMQSTTSRVRGRRLTLIATSLGFCVVQLDVSVVNVAVKSIGASLGGGLIVPVITSELLGSVDRSRSGVAAGTLNTLRQAGSALGVALFGSLIATAFIGGMPSRWRSASV